MRRIRGGAIDPYRTKLNDGPDPRRPFGLPAVLLTLLLAFGFAMSCGTRGRPRSLRAGFQTSLTHAIPMLVEDRGELPDVTFVPFRDGPSEIEALLAGDLDVAWCGPGPAINAYVRTHGRVRVLAGAAAGGDAFVVQGRSAIHDAQDLRHAKLATPQIGNTQDIALRYWLDEHLLRTTDRGGDVLVLPTSNAELFSLFLARQIDGAWTTEPWVTRLVREGGGRILVSDIAGGGGRVWPTTLLVVRDGMPAPVLRRLAQANARTVHWARTHPEEAKRRVRASIVRVTGAALPPAIVGEAWTRVRWTTDPMPRELEEIARRARRLGYLPEYDLDRLLIAPRELSGTTTASPTP